MKNHALLVLLLISGSAMAQTSLQTPWLEKSEIQIGVSGGANFGGNTEFSTRTAPYIQYFIKDRWAIRLEGQYEVYRIQGQGNLRYDIKRSQYLGAALATQYHFLKTDRFSLYGQAGYSYGQHRANLNVLTDPDPKPMYTSRTNYGRFSLGVGAQYRLGERWMINALVEQQSAWQFNLKGGSTSVQLGVGFRLR